jgi:hypothetical protein
MQAFSTLSRSWGSHREREREILICSSEFPKLPFGRVRSRSFGCKRMDSGAEHAVAEQPKPVRSSAARMQPHWEEQSLDCCAEQWFSSDCSCCIHHLLFNEWITVSLFPSQDTHLLTYILYEKCWVLTWTSFTVRDNHGMEKTTNTLDPPFSLLFSFCL